MSNNQKPGSSRPNRITDVVIKNRIELLLERDRLREKPKKKKDEPPPFPSLILESDPETFISTSISNTQPGKNLNEPGFRELLVRWSYFNKDLGTHHNVFLKEFPNCIFVRVLKSGPGCKFENHSSGGLALITEGVMKKKGALKLDNSLKLIIDRSAQFIISEDDIIVFGKLKEG